MFKDCSSLKGAVSYESDKVNSSMANYRTGYFTVKCSHKNEDGTSALGEEKSVAATCVEAAHKEAVCSLCSTTVKYDMQGEADPKAHRLTAHDAVSATCDTQGRKAYYECSLCNKLYEDAETTKEVPSADSLVIKATGHVVGDDGICSVCGYHLYTTDGVKMTLPVGTGYPWICSDRDDMPGFMSNNKGMKSTVSRHVMELSSDKQFAFHFDYQVDANVEHRLEVYVDGKKVVWSSGKRSSRYFTLLSEGTHKVEFLYNKDNETDYYADRAYVYNIEAKTAYTDADIPLTPRVEYDSIAGTLTFVYKKKTTPADSKAVEFALNAENETAAWAFDDLIRDVQTVVFDESFKDARPVSCSRWFYHGGNISKIKGIENLNTSETLDMSDMFMGSYLMWSLDLSPLNTDKVVNMRQMFRGCANLVSLDISGFSMKNVTNAEYMFYMDASLKTIYVGDSMKVRDDVAGNRMFYDCTSLQGAISYDANKTGFEYANYRTGYFTYKCNHLDSLGVSTLTNKREVEATCILAAYTEYDCTKCNQTIRIYHGEPDSTKHKTQYIPDQPATCIQNGTKALYVCEICYRGFEDAEGKIEIKDPRAWTLPALGHVLDETGQCKNCQVQLLTLQGVRAEWERSSNMLPWDTYQEEGQAPGFSVSPAAAIGSEYATKLVFKSDKPFVLSFDYFLNSPGNYQRTMSILLDGESMNVPSSEKKDSFSSILPAGEHTLVFEYYQWSQEYGNYAWVNNIKARTDVAEDELPKKVTAVFDKNTQTLTLSACRIVPPLSEGQEAYQQKDVTGEVTWFNVLPRVKKAVIDASMKDIAPRYMYSWFYGAAQMKTIEGLENLNTSEVEYISAIFMKCSALDTLDLSSFNTPKLKEMYSLFTGCTNLKVIYATDSFWVEDSTSYFILFDGCTSLQGAIAYDENKVDHSYANYRTGYFTLKCSHVDSLGTSYLQKLRDVEATCVLAAHTEYFCSRCTRSVNADFVGQPSTVHTPQAHAAKAATCTNEGNTAYYECTVCGRYFADEACSQEIVDKNSVTLKATWHDFDAEGHCAKCGLTDERYKELQLQGVKAQFKDEESYPWIVSLRDDCAPGITSSNSGQNATRSQTTLCLKSEENMVLSFDVHVSSWYGDALNVSIDGKPVIYSTGYNMGSYVFSLPAGEHNIVFSYEKDENDSGSDDAAYAYNIKATTRQADDDYEPLPYMFLDNETFELTFKTERLIDPSALKGLVGYLGTEELNPLYCSIPEGTLSNVYKVVMDSTIKSLTPTSCEDLFYSADGLEEIENLEYLNTSEVEDMTGMFGYCPSLKTLRLDSFKTDKVEYMNYMFELSTSLRTLDLSTFNTSNVGDMESMFYGCSGLRTIYVGKGFTVDSVERSEDMFYGCTNLSGAVNYNKYYMNDTTFANYRRGYFKTYYKVGDEIHDLCGENLSVDSLTLLQGAAFFTHAPFRAGTAAYRLTLGDDNVQKVGTICLPYAIENTDDYTLYSIRAVRYDAATDPDNAVVELEKVTGTLPAGTPAVFKARSSQVTFRAVDALVTENPTDQSEEAVDGCYLNGSFLPYVLTEGYASSGNKFETAVSGSEWTLCEPFTAGISLTPDSDIKAKTLWLTSTDGNIVEIRTARTDSDKGKVEYYNLEGYKLNGLQKGINIIRYGNGKGRKVFVK